MTWSTKPGTLAAAWGEIDRLVALADEWKNNYTEEHERANAAYERGRVDEQNAILSRLRGLAES